VNLVIGQHRVERGRVPFDQMAMSTDCGHEQHYAKTQGPPSPLTLQERRHDPTLAVERGKRVLQILDPRLDLADQERTVFGVPR